MGRLALLLLVGTALGAPALDRHPWARARETAGDRFVIETDTFPELARSLRASLRRAYALYQDRFGPLEGRARLPIRVALFRDRESYMRHGNGVAGAVGHFDPALDRCALVWEGGVGERGWPVAVHEAGHNYFRRRFPNARPPTWYAEGMACYFEGANDPTSRDQISPPRLRTAQAALAAGDADLSLLLLARARVREGRLRLDNYEPTRYYGLAWSLIHFLTHDPHYRDRFRRFELRLLASQPLPGHEELHARRLLREECGDLNTLERSWKRHLAALEVPPQPPAVAVYAWELDAPRPLVRYAALHRLREGSLTRALRAGAVRCLDDPDLIVRTAAARLIATEMRSDAVPAMVRLLDLGDSTLATIALRALADPCATQAVPRLLAERRRREEALRALAEIRDPRAFPALRHALMDPLFAPRTRALCAAALADDPAAARALKQAARDGDVGVRTAAALSLARLETNEPPLVVDKAHLIDILRAVQSPPGAKAAACAALAALGDRQVVGLLRDLCRPIYPERVRLAALRALIALTGETRGFVAGQSARRREAVYRAWTAE